MTTHTLKTIELSDCDISSYLNIYNKIFETEKSVGVFKNEYMNTPLVFHITLFCTMIQMIFAEVTLWSLSHIKQMI